MNEKVEGDVYRYNGIKWLIVFAILAGAVAGFTKFSTEYMLYSVIGMLVLVVLAAIVAVNTPQGRGFWDLCLEARTEIRKVVWPTNQETVQTTLIVLVAVFVIAIVLSLIDWVLGLVTEYFIG